MAKYDKFPEDAALMQWEHAGLNCAIASSGIGFVNGYVQVPENHPTYKLGYDRLYDLDVHGGLTYANDRGWFGFDTGHYGDYWSDEQLAECGMSAERKYRSAFAGESIYHIWNKAALVAEVEKLAEALAILVDVPLPPPTKYNVTEEEFSQLLADQKELQELKARMTNG